MKRPGSKIEGCEIARDILAYLSEHPQAQDTVQGIVQWWLLEQEIKSRIRQVERALASLVAERFVVERKGKDSKIHYRINRRKMSEIESFLKREGRRKRPSARRNAPEG